MAKKSYTFAEPHDSTNPDNKRWDELAELEDEHASDDDIGLWQVITESPVERIARRAKERADVNLHYDNAWNDRMDERADRYAAWEKQGYVPGGVWLPGSGTNRESDQFDHPTLGFAAADRSRGGQLGQAWDRSSKAHSDLQRRGGEYNQAADSLSEASLAYEQGKQDGEQSVWQRMKSYFGSSDERADVDDYDT